MTLDIRRNDGGRDGDTEISLPIVFPGKIERLPWLPIARSGYLIISPYYTQSTKSYIRNFPMNPDRRPDQSYARTANVRGERPRWYI